VTWRDLIGPLKTRGCYRNLSVDYRNIAVRDSKENHFILNALRSNSLRITSLTINDHFDLANIRSHTLTNLIIKDSPDNGGKLPNTQDHLAEFLMAHPLLATISLEGRLSDIRSIIESHVTTQTTIRKLTLSNCELEPALLGESSSLTSLICKRLSHSSLDAWTHVFTQLKLNKNLVELSLADCSIDDEICEQLVGSLLLNSTLQTLDLSMNRISNSSVKIFEWLATNSTLRVLSLSSNHISHQAQDFIFHLKSNTNLEKMYFWGNQISFVGKQQLQLATMAEVDFRWDRQIFLKTKMFTQGFKPRFQ